MLAPIGRGDTRPTLSDSSGRSLRITILLKFEHAETHYRQALALATDLGMRPLVAHCHLGLGELYRRVGKRQEAQEHLTTATSTFREMDMSFWLAKAGAEMAELKIRG